MFSGLLAFAKNASYHPIETTSQFTERSIGRDISILEDPHRQWTFEQVRNPEIADRFEVSSYDIPSFGYSQSAYWVRFDFQNMLYGYPSTQDDVLFLKLGNARTNLVELQCINFFGEITPKQRAGDHVLRSEWPTSYREPVFKIEPGAQTCWLRVQSNTPLHLPLTLYRPIN
jgi:hypothetical protein